MDIRIRLAEKEFVNAPYFESALHLANVYVRAGGANTSLATSIRNILAERMPMQDVPRVILYAATDYELENQESLDFRSILQRPPAPDHYPHYRNFPHSEFNGNIRFSIQAGTGHYSSPQAILDSNYGYSHWEAAIFDEDGMFCPAIRTGIYGWDDDKHDEEWEELQQQIQDAEQDPLAEVDLEMEEIVHTSPKVIPGGILYGIPHLNIFSTADSGVIPWGSTHDIQDIFDFLRARFGLMPPL